MKVSLDNEQCFRALEIRSFISLKFTFSHIEGPEGIGGGELNSLFSNKNISACENITPGRK